jgi:hypothetical protein
MANFQTVTAVKLGQAATTTGYVTLYTTPLLAKTYVKQFDINNTSAVPATFYIHIIPVGGTAGTGNSIFYNAPIAGNTTVQWSGVEVMNAGDFIQIKGSGTTCAVTASGGEAV